MIRLIHIINRICVYFATAFLGIMVLSIFYQVVARYLFNSPPAWTEEIARYLQIWVVCLMVSPLILSSEHIEIDIVFNMLSHKTQKRIDLIRHSITLIFGSILLYLGILLNCTKKAQASPALEISMAWIYWVIPVMAALIVVSQLEILIGVSKKKESISE